MANNRAESPFVAGDLPGRLANDSTSGSTSTPRDGNALSATELALAETWTEVLGCARPGRDDDFFELGGQSLDAVRLATRAGRRFGVDVPAMMIFERPTLGAYARGVEAVLGAPARAPVVDPADRRTRLAQHLRAGRRGVASNPVHGEASHPLATPAQQAMWLIERLGDAGSAYVIAQRTDIEGALDLPALERALQALVERHEALRTAFVDVDGAPRIDVHRSAVLETTLEVLAPSPAPDDARLGEIERAFVAMPFDLASPPLMRVRIVQCAARRHVMYLAIHHIVADGWSMGIIARDLGVLYAAEQASRPADLPSLTGGYARYASWMHDGLEGGPIASSVAYWRERLANVEPLALPADRPRSARPTRTAGHVHFRLDRDLVERVDKFARAHGATRYMALLAGFAALIGRYSGQADVCVGTPVAGRPQLAFEPVVGYFANMVVMRTDLAGEPGLATLLGRVREAALDAFRHAAAPFERVVAAVAPARQAGVNPIFQVSFALQNLPPAELEIVGATCTTRRVAVADAQFDLSLVLTEADGGLDGVFHYAAELFDVERIERTAAHYERLLTTALDDPGRPLAEIDLVDERALRQLLAENEAAARAFPRDATMMALLAPAVSAAPDSIAIVHGERRVDFGALDAQSNRLAHRLRALGVGRESLVALCMPRCVDAVVAMIAVLKAGGAYLPLDPAHPIARRDAVLVDANPVVLLGPGDTVAALTPPAATRVLAIDHEEALIASESADSPACVSRASDLAYVIYTSGSTGTPKGVAIEHRQLANHTAWFAAQFALAHDDRFLVRTTLAFDAAGVEIWPALVAGATLVIADEDDVRDPGTLLALVRDQGVTRMQLVPGQLAAVLDELENDPSPLPLRTLFVGGDALLRTDVERWQARTDVELVNLYGPTECAIDATWHACTRPLPPGQIPIGRPVGNARVYVLDERLRPVPVGLDGEICIGGDVVGRGYLGRPELTAARFVADPFAPEPGARMYRTGDRGRVRLDGTVEYHGRMDRQVKLRGFRIELGEVEAALVDAGARRAVAQVRPDAGGTARLVAYVETSSLEASSLREALAERLPEYMVPAAIVVLESLPVLANGKLDRNALPAPAFAPARGLHEAPGTPTERAVAAVWGALLGDPHVGRNDDFFALGGDSLLAARAIARTRGATGVNLSVRVLFEEPTLVGFAARVDALARENATSGTDALQHGTTTVPSGPDGPPAALSSGAASRVAAVLDARQVPAASLVPATSSQQALWYVESLTGARAAYQIAQAYRIEGELDEPVLREAIALLCDRHEAMRASFSVVEGSLCMRVHDTVVAALERIEPGSAIQEFVERPFDLGCAPLWRAAIARDPDGTRTFVLVMHHIVTDGWSMGIIVRELATAYAELLAGRDPGLAAPSASYSRYAQWHRNAVCGEHAASSLAYWRARLAGIEPLELPLDRPRPAARTHAGGLARVAVDAARLDAIKALARRHRASLFMVLLAAWKAVLGRHSGRADIAVGTPVAGRTRTELESLVGYLVNMVVVRTDVPAELSFAQLVSRVKAGVLEGLDHQDIPFDCLVSEIAPRRDAGINPLFQVAFALQNAPAASFELPGVRCSALSLGARQSKFDLTLSLTEVDGRLEGVVEYASELFDAPRIERMVGHFERVLAQVVENDRVALAELELIGPDERARLELWATGEQTRYPADATLAALFAAQARRAPDATAVVGAAGTLSYAQLNARANQVAHWLRAAGAGPGSVVATCLERGDALLVALLGIVKAGAAYLPLDPHYPGDRLRFMLADAAPIVLIGESSLLAALMPSQVSAGEARRRRRAGAGDPRDDGPPRRAVAADVTAGAPLLLAVDRDAAQIAAQPMHDPEPLGDGADLAYLMYTSGSTGTPKGALVTQRAVARLVVETDYVSIGADDVVAQVSNGSFDAATFEIWGAWLNGACLVVLPSETVLSSTALAASIEEHAITTMFLTTALFNAHVASDPTMFAPLRTLLFGGEAADAAAIRRVLESGGAPARLGNAYGPTETTTFATVWFAPPAEQALARETRLGVPIGRPIANTTCQVLDAAGHLQPIGVVGELHIGGPGVARGYLNREALSNERFVPDPDCATGSLRYRTGDLVRWREDGTLLYVGRNDQQVKIRGFRIETGEIVAAMQAAAPLREAAVLVVDRPPAGKRLVGFVVPVDVAGFELPALRAALRERLPEFMLPAAIHVRDALPVTANGKLDRAALLASLEASAGGRVDAGGGDTGFGERGSTTDGPEGSEVFDEATQRLLALWRRILDAPQLSPDENFFDAGGHSLLALRMLGEVEREFGRVLRVATLFEAPTARAFATRLHEGEAEPVGGCAVTVQHGGRAAPLFVVSGYGGEIVVFRDLARALGAQQGLVVLDTTAFRATDIAGQSLEAVAARMLADLRRVQAHGPYHLCGYSLGGKFVYEIARQLVRAGETVALLALMDCNAPGYPSRRPMTGRIAAHLRQMLRQSFAENVRHLRARLDWVAWLMRERDLFEHAGELARTSVAQSMKASAEAFYTMWRAHAPGRYGGPMLVVRAGIRPQRPGVVDDDPRLGWSTLVDGPIEFRDLDADHLSMLEPAHAPQLAAILSEYLGAVPRDPAQHLEPTVGERAGPRHSPGASREAAPESGARATTTREFDRA